MVQIEQRGSALLFSTTHFRRRLNIKNNKEENMRHLPLSPASDRCGRLRPAGAGQF
jgi:hypothetical protein